jgi:N-acetylmuramoyl-L-alanine amidase
MDHKRVILHCSATPDYPDSSKKYDLFGVDDFREWHTAKGWDDVGYHYVVRRTGVIELGRDVDTMGAHTKGENDDSIGVCYVGTRWPTKEQCISLRELHRDFQDWYNLESGDWFGHYEFNKKKNCPGIPMDIVRGFLSSEVLL